jgi:RNA polymerase sigma-70 factor (ECF subfamily)
MTASVNKNLPSQHVNERPPDLDIALGMRNGDRKAWSALCQRYGERLWRYVARMIGSDSDAVGDVYQETMLAVARAGRQLEGGQTKLWPWLAGIAHNQTALFWRKRYRDRERLGEGSTSDVETAVDSQSDGNPVAQVSQAETVREVRMILAEMRPQHALLLVAKYLDDQSVAAIVETMGGTVEGVRSGLARARRDFRERYERTTGAHSIPHSFKGITDAVSPSIEEKLR